MNKFSKNSYVLITSDADWSSESIIDYFCKKMIRHKVKPLIFATNKSKKLFKYYYSKTIDIGIHPNFRKNTTQGKNKKDVVSNLIKIFPMSKISRSHSFIDSSYIRKLLIDHKIFYDSNKLHYLQSYLRPIIFKNGIKRFPVYWSDGLALINTQKGTSLKKDLKKNKNLLSSPGLKILNIHTFNYSLNIPNLLEYERNKYLTTYVNQKKINEIKKNYSFGIQNYFDELLEFIFKNNIKVINQKDLIKFK